MVRIIASVIVLLAAQAQAQAQGNGGCQEQVNWFVGNVPNLEAQTGIGSDAALLESPTRLLLVMSAFSHAHGELMAASPSPYWRSMLIVTDGLARCFEGDMQAFQGQQLDMAKAFHERYTEADRLRFVANAIKELGN